MSSEHLLHSEGPHVHYLNVIYIGNIEDYTLLISFSIELSHTIMKGNTKRKATQFRNGDERHKKIRKYVHDELITGDRIIKRASRHKVNFLNKNTNCGLIYEMNDDNVPIPVLPKIEGVRTDFTALRAFEDTKAEEEIAEGSDINSNIIIHLGKMCDMFNTSFRNHQKKQKQLQCKGIELIWDTEESKQWGLSWKGALRCSNCRFRSGTHKLYEEVETGSPHGPKPAQTTYGVQVGLSKNGVSNTGLIEILESANINPPAYSTLQRAANAVGRVITETNKEDLQKQADHLKDLNISLGMPEYGPIPAEADGTYNNSVFSKIGKSPFQAATQVDFTLTENLTEEKKIISVVSHSKLCSCPKHKEHLNDCTATLDQDATIGNEGAYLTEAVAEVNDNGLEIGIITLDGDSSSRSQALQIAQPHGTVMDPKHCKWHLKRTYEKKMKGHKFSERMIKGRNKVERDQARKRFALDISNRVTAEVETAHKLYGGDIEAINKKMTDTVEAVIDCYRGDCQNCDEHSLVCSEEKRWNRPFLDINHKHQRDFMVNADSDDLQFIRDMLSMRMGPEAIYKTSNDSTQNKSEAGNRGIKKAKPKQLTFARNSEMRTHSAVHSMNNGPGSSIISLCEAVGAPVSGSSPRKTARKLDAKKEYHQQRKKQYDYTLGRRMAKQSAFKLWDLKANEIRPGYIKDAGAEELIVYQPPKNKGDLDHNYMTNTVMALIPQ